MRPDSWRIKIMQHWRANAINGALAAAMLSVGSNCNSREGEIMPMRVDQIDFADRTIRLEVDTTKNGHGRIVKMTQEVYMLIQACASRNN